MPLSVSTIRSETRTATISFLGEELHVTYRPGLITPDRDQLSHMQWLPQIAVAWDLLGEDGEPYPLTPDAVAALPDQFIVAVNRGILEHSKLDPFTSATSAGG